MAQNLLQYIFSLVFTLAWHVCLGEICPENPEVTLKPKKQKTCPDFKDDADQSACCPSQITLGSYYCCTVGQKAEIESQIASESRRQFIREYLAVIIICSIFSALFILVLTTLICKRIACCPLYRRKTSSTMTYHSQIRSRYRQVEPPPSKPPATYEAPPPYEFHGYTSTDIIRREALQQHDYNCLLENRLNDVRSDS